MSADSRRGMLSAAAAYTMWGLFPLYFKRLAGIPALEVVAHRTVWCLLFLAGVLLVLTLRKGRRAKAA